MVKPDQIKVERSSDMYMVGELIEQHPYLTYLRPGVIVGLFEGVDTLLDYVGQYMKTAKQRKSSIRTGDDDFNAFRTYKEAFDILRNKPQEVTKFDPAEIRVRDISESGLEIDYDVVGDYIDMGRHMEGLPESWGSMRNGNARNRRVNIMVNLSNGGSMGEKEINHRSERILRLVDALEMGGVRTEVVAIESTECSHLEIKIKRHDETLNISDMAVVTHSEFLRRISFRITEYSKTFSDGYGSSIVFSDAVSPETIEQGSNSEMDIFIDSNIRGYALDNLFDGLERLIAWEMGKPIPEVSSIKVDKSGVWFNPNGARDEESIRTEGQAAINA
jgi:hypothetical protein